MTDPNRIKSLFGQVRRRAAEKPVSLAPVNLGPKPKVSPKATNRKWNFQAGLTLEYFFERSIPEPNSGCWLWEGALYWNGYAALNIRGRVVRAHRACLKLRLPDLARGIDACHSCDVRSCVNPDHIFAGTRRDNMQDCKRKGRFHFLVNLPGEACRNSKLTNEEVLAIRADPRSSRAIAATYSVSKGTVLQIRARKIWRHL
jgi:hypothetical protein